MHHASRKYGFRTNAPDGSRSRSSCCPAGAAREDGAMTEPERVGGPFDDEPEGSVALDQVPEGAVLTVAGALDLSLAAKLRRTVERAARLRPALLVIDLTGVTFL